MKPTNVLLFAYSIGILILILIGMTCNKSVDLPKVVIKHDTVKVVVSKTEVKPLQYIHDTSYVILDTDTLLMADSNYDILKDRFEKLVTEYTASNRYKDTIKIDTFGYIVITDTVQFNKLKLREYKYDYTITSVNTTKEIHHASKRQLYFGGNIMLNNNKAFESINTGLIYKSKKDQLYMFNVGMGLDGNLNYNLGTYFKLKFKK
jgi:hypothetical protein